MNETSSITMMSENSPFLTLEQPCNVAVDWVSGRINQAGLLVLRTFDLQVARLAHSLCPCPHHGTGQCDCQMVVLLVYQVNRQPITLIAHGFNSQTWFSFVDTPYQRADPHLQAHIRRMLDPSFFAATSIEKQARVV